MQETAVQTATGYIDAGTVVVMLVPDDNGDSYAVADSEETARRHLYASIVEELGDELEQGEIQLPGDRDDAIAWFHEHRANTDKPIEFHEVSPAFDGGVYGAAAQMHQLLQGLANELEFVSKTSRTTLGGEYRDIAASMSSQIRSTLAKYGL
jgi:hypothetical protein